MGQPKWTVMVFMGAATFDGTLSLAKAAADDLEEMRAIGSVDNRLEILVELWDDNEVTREHVGRRGSKFNSKNPVPMALDGEILLRFVKAALTHANHGPDDYTLLVLWGHTFDFAFGRRRNRNGEVDALDFAELTSKLDEFQKSMGGRKLHIVGFDSCEVSTVEMACQLHPYADYLLSSEIGVPLPGWPYDRILARVADPQGDRGMGPAELGSYIVRRFCESYPAKDEAVSLTLLDLRNARELAALVGWLSQKLALAIGEAGGEERVMDLLAWSQTEPRRPYVDVADFCVSLLRESGHGGVMAAAAALGDFLMTPAEDVVGRSLEGTGRPFIVEHGRNAGILARLNGISLYVPHLAPDKDPGVAEKLYDNFKFTEMNLWRDLVHALARS